MVFNRKKYDLILSIGEACSCTQTLRNAGLQIASFPFDWVVGGTLPQRIEIIRNKFEDYFVREDLEDMHRENGASRPNYVCHVFKSKKYDVRFMHDFLLSFQSFDEAYSSIEKKYQRRADRLMKQMEKAKRILFVYLEMPCSETPLSLTEAETTQRELQSLFPNKTIDVFALSCDKSIPFKKRKIEKSDSVTKVSFNYKRPNADNEPNRVNSKLLKKYFRSLFRLNLSLKEKLLQKYRGISIHIQKHILHI